MIRYALATLALLAAAPAIAAPLDDIAEAYVKLALEAGEREPGFVDAYAGPPEWQAAAKAKPRTIPDLIAAAKALKARTEAVPAAKLPPLEQRRRTFLIAQLTAAETRLRMDAGEHFSFADEAEGLFGYRPVLKPLSAYDPVLRRIAALVPGDGDLATRVEAYRDRFVIPADKLRPVMEAAIAECRRRTVPHIPMPTNERFELSLVTGKPWSGYNWFKGDAKSLIEVNTDLPVRIDRAVDLGCHEGYPGHHVANSVIERDLAGKRGWVEFSVYPLFSPQSFLMEGSANYGIDLAFPGDDKAKFEAATLYPLAGLAPAEASKYEALRLATSDLSGANMTIAEMYLDKKIGREEAIALVQKYQLVGRARAEKSLSFMDGYRSYVINYGLGQDAVKAAVERAGTDPARRWARFTALLNEPTVPADLAR